MILKKRKSHYWFSLIKIKIFEVIFFLLFFKNNYIISMNDKTTEELEDCFFIPNEETDSIATCCLKCYQEKFKNQGGMFWNGSSRGYGPWEIKCNSCEKIIQKGPDANK